jgi:hypothetical protein
MKESDTKKKKTNSKIILNKKVTIKKIRNKFDRLKKIKG